MQRVLMSKETLDPHDMQLVITVKLNSTPFLKVQYTMLQYYVESHALLKMKILIITLGFCKSFFVQSV